MLGTVQSTVHYAIEAVCQNKKTANYWTFSCVSVFSIFVHWANILFSLHHVRSCSFQTVVLFSPTPALLVNVRHTAFFLLILLFVCHLHGLRALVCLHGIIFSYRSSLMWLVWNLKKSLKKLLSTYKLLQSNCIFQASVTCMQQSVFALIVKLLKDVSDWFPSDHPVSLVWAHTPLMVMTLMGFSGAFVSHSWNWTTRHRPPGSGRTASEVAEQWQHPHTPYDARWQEKIQRN